MSDELQKLVEDWIKAEFHFRIGAYGGVDPLEAQKMYVMAEKRLRKAVTGKKELLDAGTSLGLKMAEYRFTRNRKDKRK
jgi:hypothetical protein